MNQGWGTKSRASLLAPVFSLSSVSSTLYLLMKPNPLREHMHWDLSCYRRLSTLSFYSFSVCLLTCWNFRWCFLFPHWFMYLSVILRSSHPAALLFPSFWTPASDLALCFFLSVLHSPLPRVRADGQQPTIRSNLFSLFTRISSNPVNTISPSVRFSPDKKTADYSLINRPTKAGEMSEHRNVVFIGRYP